MPSYIELCNKKIDELNEIDRKNKEIATKKRKKITTIAFVIVLVLVVLGIVYITVLAPLLKYGRAISFYKKGDNASAYVLFNELGDYKKSSSYKEITYPDYLKSLSRNYSIGDIVTLGAYEQDNNSTNGKESIEWIVLNKEDDRLLIISRYALDCQPFNTVQTDVTWETCSLREWLNSAFYNSAFSELEKQCILTSTVTADENPDYSTDQGNDTQDSVFLLSISEIKKYCNIDSKRQCEATEYAYQHGAYKGNNGNCWWWLRTSGYDSSYAARVHNVGYVHSRGLVVNDNLVAVRPAIWISLPND